MASLNTPHLSYPFRLRRPIYVEQDSDEHIDSCALTLLAYEQGQRISLPDFGRPDSSFAMGGADTDAILAVIQKYEPRAAADISADLSKLEQMLEVIRINLGSATVG